MDMLSFINQHKDISDSIRQINALIKGDIVKNAIEVRKLLSDLIERLSIHLIMEDKNIYPKAASSNNPELKIMAIKLQSEMLNTGQKLKDYSARWSSPARINEDQSSFISETNIIFSNIEKRILAEEKELYPLCMKLL